MKLKRIMGFSLVLCLLLGVMSISCGFSVGAQTDIQSYIDERLEEEEFIGVFYATRDGQVICQSARGMANTAQSKEMSLDTLFPIGSNSKQFCSTAIMLLKEQDKLSLSDKIQEYFPEYTTAKDVTIKDLLTMRSGIVDHLTDGLWQGEVVLSADTTAQENEQIILDWLYSRKLMFKANSGYYYSNSNYFLLALIVEQVSGQDYEEFIEENIFEPLGMSNTGFYENLMNHPDLAESTYETDEPIEPELKGLTKGAGDIVSTVLDMDKWMSSYKECSILTEESIDEMTTAYTRSTGYGYGIGVMEDGGLMYTGGIVSYLSIMRIYPEEGVNVFAVTNDMEIDIIVLDDLVTEITEKTRDLKICGDVNEDTKVNIKDATAIQKHLADLATLSQSGYAAADVTMDGAVNVRDATAIQKYLAGMDTGLHIGDFF